MEIRISFRHTTAVLRSIYPSLSTREAAEDRRMAGLIVSRTTYSAVRNSIYTVNTHPPLGGISALNTRRSKHVDIGYYRETAAASIKLR